MPVSITKSGTYRTYIDKTSKAYHKKALQHNRRRSCFYRLASPKVQNAGVMSGLFVTAVKCKLMLSKEMVLYCGRMHVTFIDSAPFTRTRKRTKSTAGIQEILIVTSSASETSNGKW